MSLFYRNPLLSTVLVSVTSAAPEQILDAILREKITITQVIQQNDLICQFLIRRKDLTHVVILVQRMGGKLVVLNKRGLYWKVHTLYHRPVICTALLSLVLCSVFLPTRILFVQAEGNDQLSERQILDAAEYSGICFGASRRLVRSEKVKNTLLAQLPQLQWAGVNTTGCTAVISVRERAEEKKDVPKSFSNLIATQDGYILSQTILKGSPMFAAGDAVTRGQILISGYTDCGICIRATRAEGEVLAQTNRDITAVCPAATATIHEITDRKYKISLLIRKKRINLWKDSRISDTGCGRMYAEYFVSLPGGFQLPVAICIDQYLEYHCSNDILPKETVQKQLQLFSDKYLLRQTVSGQILQKQYLFQEHDGIYMMNSHYVCSEMIGREQGEQIGDRNEQRN